MDSLNSLNIKESGCADFKQDEFKDYYVLCLDEQERQKRKYSKNFQKFLRLLIFEHFFEFEEIIEEHPEYLAEKEIKILWALNHIAQNKELTRELFIPNFASAHSKKRLSQSLSKELIEITHQLKSNIRFSQSVQARFEQYNYFVLQDYLPDILFYYAQYILDYQIQEKYSELYSRLQNFKFVDFCDGVEAIEDRQEAEKLRLLAYYYRRIGDEKSAEEYLMKYREIMPDDIQSSLSPEIRPKANLDYFIPEDTLIHWEKILAELNAVQNDVTVMAPLHKDTCGYFKCDDCCNYTSPHMSFTEFKYLEKWIQENNYPIQDVLLKNQEIQTKHEELFGEKLKVIDKSLPENQEKGIENPFGFKYSCPFLVEKRCSIYEARPLACRGFGLSTDDNLSIKTCNFYSEQYIHNCSRDNERYVYDLRPVQVMAKASDRYLTELANLDKKELKGTIVAFLSEFLAC